MLLLFGARPSRLYLSSVSFTGAFPPMGTEWEHLLGFRGRFSLVRTGSPISQFGLNEGVDHLVDADVLVGQWITPYLAAQTLAAQTVTLTVQASTPDANNHLHLTWRLYVLRPIGSTGPVLVPIRRDDLEVPTVRTARTDSVAIPETVLLGGDRLVLELGLGGLPTDAAGVQSHSCRLYVGDDGTTDLAAADGDTTVGPNPWFEIPQRLLWSTTTTVDLRASSGLAVASQRTIDIGEDNDPRIPDNWDQITANGFKASTAVAVVRGTARTAILSSVPTSQTSVTMRAVGTTAAVGARVTAAAVTLEGRTRAAATTVRGALSDVLVTAGGSSVAAGVQGSLGAVELAAAARAISSTIKAAAAPAIGVARSRSASVSTADGTTTVALRGQAGGALVGVRSTVAQAAISGRPRELVSALRASAASADLSAAGRVVTLARRTGLALSVMRAGLRGTDVGTKVMTTTAGWLFTTARIRLMTLGETNALAEVHLQARFLTLVARASATVTTVTARGRLTATAVSGSITALLVRARTAVTVTTTRTSQTSVRMAAGSHLAASVARKGALSAAVIESQATVMVATLEPAGVTSVTMRAGSGLAVPAASRSSRTVTVTTAHGRMALVGQSARSVLVTLAAAAESRASGTTTRAGVAAYAADSSGLVLIGLAQVIGRVTAGAAPVGGVQVGAARISRMGAGTAAGGDVAAGARPEGDVEAGAAGEGRVLVGAGPR